MDLIAKGDAVAATHRPGDMSKGWLDPKLFGEWQAQALTFLSGMPGAEVYYERFESTVLRANGGLGPVRSGIGILNALRQDLEAGHLTAIRGLIAGEVFGDFLGAAQHLADEGHPLPAIALAGAVLEDGLRRIAAQAGLSHSPKAGLKDLVDVLHKGGVIKPLVAASLKALADLRNDVDHGNWQNLDGVDAARALRVVDEVRSTLANHLG